MQPIISEHRRIIAIGDIHGCIASLKKLIEIIDPEPFEQLVFLGDYIDRGNHSKEVLDYLIELGRSYSCHFIMGNHELMFLDHLKGHHTKEWLANGGKATIKSYQKSPSGLYFSQEHRAFFNNCHLFIETENYFFAHGGLDPELTVKDNLMYYKHEDFCWQRMHMRTNFLESKEYKWEKTVVCAHTAISEPIMLDKLIAIDTGCVYKEEPLLGKLTAVILPERRFVQTENVD